MDTQAVVGKHYLPRVLDQQLERLLRYSGGVVIEGPRACGKTMTGLQHASSYVFVDTPESALIAAVDPAVLLEGDRPRLIDEWQHVPQLWNLARHAVDASPEPGSLILTGSAVPTDDSKRHTGAGRFMRIRQRTMTWAEKRELLDAPGVSLRSLVEGQPVRSNASQESVTQVITTLLQPGFPALRQSPEDIAAAQMTSYISDIATYDLNRLTTLKTEPEAISTLIQALARNTGTEVTISTLRKDIQQILPAPSEQTIAKIIELLQRVFVVETVPAWAPHLRSRARLRRSPKYHLADPALTAAALDGNHATLLGDLETTGFLFESAAIHDLLVNAEAIGGKVYHYRDSNGHEMDAVITFPGGAWGAVEVKLGYGQIEAGASSLNSAIQQISANPPAFKAVITGTGFTATLPDGTLTFPLSALRP